MILQPRMKGRNATTLGGFALVCALVVVGLMVEQVLKKGSEATLERAEWWPPFVVAELFFLAVLAAVALAHRKRREP